MQTKDPTPSGSSRRRHGRAFSRNYTQSGDVSQQSSTTSTNNILDHHHTQQNCSQNGGRSSTRRLENTTKPGGPHFLTCDERIYSTENPPPKNISHSKTGHKPRDIPDRTPDRSRPTVGQRQAPHRAQNSRSAYHHTDETPPEQEFNTLLKSTVQEAKAIQSLSHNIQDNLSIQSETIGRIQNDITSTQHTLDITERILDGTTSATVAFGNTIGIPVGHAVLDNQETYINKGRSQMSRNHRHQPPLKATTKEPSTSNHNGSSAASASLADLAMLEETVAQLKQDAYDINTTINQQNQRMERTTLGSDRAHGQVQSQTNHPALR